MRAGLLASLSAGALPGSEGWAQLVMRPGTHPIREHARVALRRAEPSHDGVADLLKQMVYGPDAPRRSVVVVDQMEELWAASVDPAERATFLDALAEIVGSDSPCAVVLVLRADFVDRLTDQPSLARAVGEATLLAGSPTDAEVRRVVERPAARAQLDLDVGLADAIVADAVGEPGALPLLSTALVELWEARAGQRLTLAAYVTAGGIRGAVARIAERAYEELDAAGRGAARILLLRLAEPGRGWTRRPGVGCRWLSWPRLPMGGYKRRRALVKARSAHVAAGHVEIAHEALFREWQRLRD